MRAAGPTTRPAHSFYKLGVRPFNPVTPCLRFLGRNNPADPLIARQRRNILPGWSRRFGGSNDFSQVRRKFMDHTGGNLPAGRQDFFLTCPVRNFHWLIAHRQLVIGWWYESRSNHFILPLFFAFRFTLYVFKYITKSRFITWVLLLCLSQ